MDKLEYLLETENYSKFIDYFTEIWISILSNVKSEIEFLGIAVYLSEEFIT